MSPTEKFSYPRDLDLRSDGMLAISIEGTNHSPPCAATSRPTVEECRSGGVDRQIPDWKLQHGQLLNEIAWRSELWNTHFPR